jgi:hypothetical protein
MVKDQFVRANFHPIGGGHRFQATVRKVYSRSPAGKVYKVFFSNEGRYRNKVIDPTTFEYDASEHASMLDKQAGAGHDGLQLRLIGCQTRMVARDVGRSRRITQDTTATRKKRRMSAPRAQQAGKLMGMLSSV